MYLTSWEEKIPRFNNEKNELEDISIKNCWKGYDFDVLNNLTEQGYLYPAKYKNKSVSITQQGELLAEKLIEKYIKESK